MTQLSRHDHLDRMREKNREAARKRTQSKVFNLQQAAISAEHLTGDKHWDVFLQYLGAEIERLEGVAQSARGILESASIVDTERLLQAKMILTSAIRARETLAAVIALPKEIIEGASDIASIEDRLPTEKDA